VAGPFSFAGSVMHRAAQRATHGGQRAADCARWGGQGMLRLPSYGLVALLYRLFWALGISSVPPEVLPYFAGSYIMDTTKLETLLGDEYNRLVRFTSEESIRETVADTTPID